MQSPLNASFRNFPKVNQADAKPDERSPAQNTNREFVLQCCLVFSCQKTPLKTARPKSYFKHS